MDKNIFFILFRYWKNSSVIFLFSIIGLSSLRCSHEPDRTLELNVLARIGDRIITVDDFIHRSEYTIRPPYCRNNTYIHKKIILNSLIAEKLFALEEGDSNALVTNADFIDYVEGRKEQAMRKVHYYEESYKNVRLDKEEIAKEMKVSERRYKISYFSLKSKKLSEEIVQLMRQDSISFKDTYFQLAGDNSIPSREISWDVPEREEIYTALFQNTPAKNDILGPINIADEQFLFIRVDGWIDTKIISEKQFSDRYKLVTDRLTEKRAWSEYQSIVHSIMNEKRIEFNPATYKDLYELIAPLYLKLEKDKKEFINNSFWEMSRDDGQFMNVPKQLSDIDSLSFFKIDNTLWTVSDFRKQMKRHPLVFRKNDAAGKTFQEQFKLAIVDMIRDYYITKDAYEKRYDLVPSVIQEKTIWQDNLLSLFYKYKFISDRNLQDKNQLQVVNDYLTPFMEEFFKKYGTVIEIDIEKFENIKISNIDMMAFQTDLPFPVVVPSFPLLTTKNRLDYGRILKTDALTK